MTADQRLKGLSGGLNAARQGAKVSAAKAAAHAEHISFKDVSGAAKDKIIFTTDSGGAVRIIKDKTISQGALEITRSDVPTHFAIEGNGQALATKSLDPNNREVIPITKYDFKPDSKGYLKNSDDQYLLAWPLDVDENIPTANQDTASLVPVNVSMSDAIVRATTKVTAGINLDSRTKLGSESIAFTSATDASELQTKLGETGSYSKIIKFKLNGVAVTPTVTIDQTSTLTSVATAINALTGVKASIENNKLVINPENIKDKLDILDETGSTNDAIAKLFGTSAISQNGFDYKRTMTIYDSLGEAREIEVYFKKTNVVNQWNVEIYSKNTSLIDKDSAGNTTTTGKIAQSTFIFSGSSGQLANITGVVGDLGSVITINWKNALTGVDPQNVTFDFGLDSAGQTTKGKITQYASASSTSYVDSNGAAIGSRTGVTLDNDGVISSIYSNGEITKDYKIAIGMVSNPDGYNYGITRTSLQVTDKSGALNLREAKKDGSGSFIASSLAGSNVDISEELMGASEANYSFKANMSAARTIKDMFDVLLQSL